MEPIVLWQTKWSHDVLVPMYLFWGGLCAGIFLVAVLADLVSAKYRPFATLSRIAAYAAVPSYVLAGIFITIHLGKPERGLAFPIFFTNYNSWMVLGGWAMGFGGPFAVTYAALHYFGVRAWIRRVVGVVGIPFLIWLAVNTGLLLSGAGFVPIWSRRYIPVIFVNSGILNGLAGAGLLFLLTRPLIAAYKKEGSYQVVLHSVSLATFIFEVIEAVLLYQFLTFLASAATQPAPTGQFIMVKGGELAYEYITRFDFCTRFPCTRGPLAPWFWGGVIAVGLVIPFILAVGNFIIRRWESIIAAVEFALILTGGAILRFVIVWGGDLKAPLAFPPSKWPIPPIGG
ncbi:MAG: polysulfide reductase NrfD [Nitrospinota bacterium]|nr:MAG: polysulfide reductase NrfD [Nitrospinota bacterium]